MSRETWAAIMDNALSGAGADDVVVAHSFGASILLHVLASGTHAPARVALLGMPNWSPAGWSVFDYEYTGAGPNVPLALHHCRDDDIVPFEHLALNATLLPQADIHEHARGGHQFEGLTRAISADLR